MRAVVDFIVAPSEHHRRHRRSTRGAACCCGRSSTCPTTRCTPRTCGSTRRSGEKGTELTGYPAISVYHEFRYHPKSVIGGTFDWIYEHLGHLLLGGRDLVADARGGHHRLQVHRLVPRPSDRGRPEALCAGASEKLGGVAHVAWKPFEHPQLGHVEIGGWNRFHAFSQSAAAAARARARALSAVAAVAGADLAEARARACGCRRRSATTRGRSRSSCRTPAGCRPTCRSARWSARSCAA